MQKKLFQTLLIAATLAIGIPAENARGSSCDTCVCYPGAQPGRIINNHIVGALINTGFHEASGSCSQTCKHNFGSAWGAVKCHSTTLPTAQIQSCLQGKCTAVIDCSQTANASKCKGI